MENLLYRCGFPTRLGACRAFVTQDGDLAGLSFGEAFREAGEHRLAVRAGAVIRDCGELPPTALETQRQLAQYFDGERRSFDLPLTLLGTAFERGIWQALIDVPWGATTSYGELATKCGTRGVRAVGTAVGKNPLCVVVPCHRVLPTGGRLGNYSGGEGPETKAFLLGLEGASFRQ